MNLPGEHNGRRNGHGGSNPHNGRDDAEAMRQRMEQLRYGMDAEVSRLAHRAKEAVDWKHYVREYPFACIGLSVLAGFMLVPSKKSLPPEIEKKIRELKAGDETAVMALAKESRRQQGWTQQLVTTLGTVATRAAMAYIGKRIGDLVPAQTQGGSASTADKSSRFDF